MQFKRDLIRGDLLIGIVQTLEEGIRKTPSLDSSQIE